MKKFTQEDVYCVVMQTNNGYARLSQWYTRQYNAEQKLKQFMGYASINLSDYKVMKFTLTEGELIENSNP